MECIFHNYASQRENEINVIILTKWTATGAATKKSLAGRYATLAPR
jgi:hypothetical protein